MNRTSADVKSYRDAILALYARAQENKEILFRGQHNAEWSLISGLGRDPISRQMDYKSRTRFQMELIEDFRRRCITNEILDAKVLESNDIALRIAQHHGLPTLRLDWTSSYYVAVAFAFNIFEKESVGQSIVRVWSLDASRFQQGALQLMRHYEPGNAAGDPDDAVLDRYYAQPDSVRLEMYCDSTNRRLNRQSGAFTECKHEVRTLDEYILGDTYGKYFPERTLTWVDMHGTSEAEAIRDLEYMGIDPARLLADLGGAAIAARNRLLRRSFSLATSAGSSS